MKRIGWALALFAIVLLAVPAAHAADDPSIQGETRSGVQKALKSHIETNTVGGTYYIYDSVAGELLE
ncbi:MAG: hypothetical protein MI919_15610, partial [Holophagales bacterium]|nr:hypothetical protein [Holophagales bacterium]